MGWLLVACTVAVLMLAVIVPAVHDAMSNADADGSGSSAPSEQKAAQYSAPASFDLTGEPDPPKGSEDEATREQLYEWEGTLRLSMGGITLYPSAEAAGISEDASSTEESVSDWPGMQVAVVDVTIENVDATCKQRVVDQEGAPCFNVNMFSGRIGSGEEDAQPMLVACVCDRDPVSLPDPEERNDTTSYYWVGKGESMDVRLAFVVPEVESSEESGDGWTYVYKDAAMPDLDWRLVVNPLGAAHAAAVVRLGEASYSDGASAPAKAARVRASFSQGSGFSVEQMDDGED